MSLTIGIELLLLSVIRIVTFFSFLPFFARKQVMRSVVMVLAISLAWGTVPARAAHYQMIHTMPQYILAIAAEVAVGWVMAYSVQTIVAAISMAGSLIDTDIGLTSGQLFDRSTGKANTFISTLYTYLFWVAFLQMKGLNALVEALMYSFTKLDYRMFFGEESFWVLILDMTSSLLILGVQLALPFMLCMFVVNIFLLILHRTAPQINIFANMFIFKIVIGTVVLYCMMPYVGQAFAILTDRLMDVQREMVRYLTS